MRLNTRYISLTLGAVALLSIPVCGTVFALSDEHARIYSQNDIEFYDPDLCTEDGNNDEACGETAKEIYWSALVDAFGPVQTAGIFGNIMNEGGFNPVSVESCTENSPYDFRRKEWKEGWSVEEYIDGEKTTSVGAFGITYQRAKYFDYIEEHEGHDLIDSYFTHPEQYSFGGCGLRVGTGNTGGDALMEAIGVTDFNRLVELEVEYLQIMLEDIGFNLEEFKALETPEDAAEYFSMNYEKCDNGCEIKGSDENVDRGKAAKKAYDEFKDFSCMATVNGEVTGADNNERLKSAVKVFGKLAMQLQKTYGTPWEVVIAQMAMESGVGTAGPGPKINNWLGINGTGDAGKQGRYAAYTSVAECVKAWAGKPVLRNGLYDYAFQYLDPNSYNLDKFIETFLPVYAPSFENDTTGYIRTIKSFIAGPIKQAREALGHPSSEEYAKQNNIPIGGKYPIGSEIGDDLAPVSSSSSKSSKSGSKSKSTPAEVTLIGDSISVQSEAELKAALPNSIFNMVGSRSPEGAGDGCANDKSGLEVLEILSKGSGTLVSQSSDNTCQTLNVNRNSLKDTVVWALGTNVLGAESEENLEKVLSLIGNKRKLYLVTVYNDLSDGTRERSNKISELYRKFAQEHDNVSVVEWNKAVAADPNKYLLREPTMVVHPTDEGKKLFADLIAKATSSGETCATSGDFMWWSQGDPALNAQDDSLSECGCGPTSFAMLATAQLGHEVNPVEVAKHARELDLWPCAAPSNLAEKLAPIYGLEFQRIQASSAQDAADKVTQLLKEGWMIQTSGNNCSNEWSPLYSYSCAGHVIGIRGITEDGKWLTANSSGNVGKSKTFDHTYDPQEFVNDDAWQWELRLDAIRGSGSVSSGACDDVCDEDGGTSSGLVAGGMDKATADAFMKKYTESDFQPVLGAYGKYHRLANCVTFTEYFIKTYTSFNVQQLGNGGDVVDNLKAQGVDTGTQPRPYAVFSTRSSKYGRTPCGDHLCGHTGVVLGIDTANNKILIGEAGYSQTLEWSMTAHEYDLTEDYTNGTFTYAYFDKYLKGI